MSNVVERLIMELEKVPTEYRNENYNKAIWDVIKYLKGFVRENTDEWIPVSSGKLPEEHESIFARFKGTDKWNDAMFEKTSDEAIVTVEFEDGARKTMTLHTIDGEWNTRDKIVKFKVIAWQSLPEPYRPSEELGEPKPCVNTACAYHKENADCEAAEGCAGYEPPAEPDWKEHMMNRFMRGE